MDELTIAWECPACGNDNSDSNHAHYVECTVCLSVWEWEDLEDYIDDDDE